MRKSHRHTHSKYGLRSQRSLENSQFDSLNSGEGYKSDGYTSYVYPNKTNPNPTLDFSGQDNQGGKKRRSQKYHTSYQPNPSNMDYTNPSYYIPPQEYYQNIYDGKANKSNDSTQINNSRQGGYELQELNKNYNYNNNNNNNYDYDIYDQEGQVTGIIHWEDEEILPERIKYVESEVSTGWFWVYKNFMWVMYWASILFIFTNVLGLLLPGYRIYCIAHMLTCAWTAQMFWYMYNAVKDKALWAAERACEMCKYYVCIAPGFLAIVNYFGLELENGLVSYIIMSYLIIGGIFYILVMRKGLELRDILRYRDLLRQRLITQGMNV